MALLRDPKSAEEVRCGLRSKVYRIRRQCFVIAAGNPGTSLQEVFDAATSDPDVMVRKWAYSSAAKMIPHDWSRFRERASIDVYSPIRRISFESFEGDRSVQPDRVLGFLFDRSAAIRRECQSVARKRFDKSAAGIYRNALESDNLHGSVDVCITGLAETGDSGDVPAIARLLSSTSARTRRSVLRAIRSLGSDEGVDLIAILRADVPSVAREAAFTLLTRRTVPADFVWRESLRNRNPRVCRAVLKLMRYAAKWAQLRVYLEAVAHSDLPVSTFAIGRLQRWLDWSNRSFAQPTSADKTDLPILFEGIREKLPAALANQLRFVVQAACR